MDKDRVRYLRTLGSQSEAILGRAKNSDFDEVWFCELATKSCVDGFFCHWSVKKLEHALPCRGRRSLDFEAHASKTEPRLGHQSYRVSLKKWPLEPFFTKPFYDLFRGVDQPHIGTNKTIIMYKLFNKHTVMEILWEKILSWHRNSNPWSSSQGIVFRTELPVVRGHRRSH